MKNPQNSGEFVVSKIKLYLSAFFLLIVILNLSFTIWTIQSMWNIDNIKAEIWLTNGYDETKRLEKQSDKQFITGSSTSNIRILIDERIKYQKMEGFGASLTDSAAWLIHEYLNSTEYEAVMDAIFDPFEGIGLSYLRLPMGSSDCSLTWYTYDDTAPDLNDFSIAHDESYIIPLIKDAQNRNPNLKIMGTPFSAPGWMKIENNLTDPTTKGLIGGYLNPDYYEMYADYFVEFIQAYKDQGIDIDAVTLQNEPYHLPADYPGMYMNETQQIAFIKVLGPKFLENEINTKILILDHNWDLYQNAMNVLEDNEARQYINGVAWHGYSSPNPAQQDLIHQEYPNIQHYFTEVTGFKAAPHFHDNLAWLYENIFIGSVNYWAKTVLLWNLALDENGGPILRPYDDMRGIITISQNSFEINYEVEYYAIGHMSKFVFPDAYRIKTQITSRLLYDHLNIKATAYLNSNGDVVVNIANIGDKIENFDVLFHGQKLTYDLGAKSILTLNLTEVN